MCQECIGLGLGRKRHLGLHVAEDRRFERVVVLLRNRIELVIVAACAVDGQPQRAFPDRADDFVEVVVAALRVVFLAEQHARAHAEEAGRDQAVVGPAVDLVAGNLFDEESIVRFVLIERLDDVVAVPPRIRAMHVVFESGRVGISRDVEPEAAVAFAVMRRRQQRIDETLPRVGRAIRNERIDFSRRRRQPEQIEIGAAHQRVAIGARRRFQRAFLTRLFKKAIDWMGEALVVDDWKRCLYRQLERPIVSLLGRDRAVLQRGERGRSRRPGIGRCIPRRALIYPSLDRRDLVRGQRRALRRHRWLFEAGNAAIHAAAGRVAGNNVQSACAAPERALACPQVEPGLLAVLAMTVPAAAFENRPDVARKRNR